MDVKKAKDLATQEITSSQSLEDLATVKKRYLGKPGVVQSYFASMSKVDPSLRKKLGKEINELRDLVVSSILERTFILRESLINTKIAEEEIDVTLPARPESKGRFHPISSMILEIRKILYKMGFAYADGPEIDDEFHVFDALNVALHHPAREMQDTLFLSEGWLLRSHTSSVQVRAMKSHGAPLKIFSAGKVYRNDWDQTHTPMFHQIEGLYIDESVTFSDLLSCITKFLNEIFGDDVKIRFRPSFFPFTEPSAEVDIYNPMLNEWMEILGCGVVNKKVLDNVKVDSAVFSGFAFGIGVERLALIKYDIEDLRMFFEGNLRWLECFGLKK